MSILKIFRNIRGMKGEFAKKEESIAMKQKKILSGNTNFFTKEAYKALRSNIIFSLSDSCCKRIIVTSSNPNEGKSTNCLNIAISFAETGAKVCLIDCDLRRPNVSRLLGQSITPGLSNVLVRLNKTDDVIRPSGFENLDVICSGDIPPNPVELLACDKMDEILDELSLKYEYIFIDTPPVNVVTDCVILSKKVMGVLFLVRQGHTEKDNLTNAINNLKFAGAKILGTVFNEVNINSGKGYKNKKYFTYR